jgi:inosose dehydratase
MTRRDFVAAAAIAPAAAASAAPNLKWALDVGTWSHLAPVPLTEILDVTRDTGFTGIRLNSYPGALERYGVTRAVLERELSRRNLQLVTVSFGGPADQPERHAEILKSARNAMEFLKSFGASDLVVFAPSRTAKILVAQRLKVACQFYNRLGEVAGEYGFRASLHNHLDALVESSDEIDLLMRWTDPKLFWLAPDTAHGHLAGCDMTAVFEKHAARIAFIDYKDARNTPATEPIRLTGGRVLEPGTALAAFFNSIYDLGDGEVDFPPLQRILARRRFRGWICPDLDYVRQGARRSFERCRAYIRAKLDPIYV